MRLYLSILAFFSLIICSGQNKIDSAIIDTISIKDSTQLSDSKSNIKVIIAKDTSQPDNFKYIFPIVTLLLGIGVNKFWDFLSYRKKIKKSGERWRAELQCLTVPLQNQILALEIFRNEHLKEIWNIPALEIQTILSCEIFKSLDKADLIKYIKTFKNKKYDDAILISNHIHGFTSILETNNINLQKKYDEYLNATSIYTTSFNKNLRGLMRAFANYQVALENELNREVTNEPNFAPIAQLFDSLILKNIFSGIDNLDIYSLRDNLFKPLAEILGHLRRDTRINEMVDGISNCLNDIKGIEMEKTYFYQNLVTLTLRYDESSRELPGIVKDLE